jgi:hypothetical protein
MIMLSLISYSQTSVPSIKLPGSRLLVRPKEFPEALENLKENYFL